MKRAPLIEWWSNGHGLICSADVLRVWCAVRSHDRDYAFSVRVPVQLLHDAFVASAECVEVLLFSVLKFVRSQYSSHNRVARSSLTNRWFFFLFFAVSHSILRTFYQREWVVIVAFLQPDYNSLVFTISFLFILIECASFRRVSLFSLLLASTLYRSVLRKQNSVMPAAFFFSCDIVLTRTARNRILNSVPRHTHVITISFQEKKKKKKRWQRLLDQLIVYNCALPLVCFIVLQFRQNATAVVIKWSLQISS